MTRATVLFTLAGLATSALAQPQGTQIVRGDASISRSGSLTQIRAANNTILNHRSFDIAAGDTVQFIQPNANSRVLNRITGAAPTRIDGSLLANGQVYLVNPAGVFFGQGSVVNTGSLIAAAGKMSDRDFLAGVDRFTNLTGDVINSGSIQAGDVVLAGAHVANDGVIRADRSAILVSGDSVHLRQTGSSSIHVKVGTVSDGATAPKATNRLGASDMLGASIAATRSKTKNNGTIAAKSIRVESAGDTVISGTLNTDGRTRGGDIQVLGDSVRVQSANITATGSTAGGEVNIGGGFQGTGDFRRSKSTSVDASSTINTSAMNAGNAGDVVVWSDGHTEFKGLITSQGGMTSGDGALVEVSGKNTLDFSGNVSARAYNGSNGTLMLDPKNVVLTLTGGVTPVGNSSFTDNATGTTSISFFPLLNLLSAGTNVTIQASNDITTASVDSFQSNIANGATLTLQAGRNISLTGAMMYNLAQVHLVLVANDSVGVLGAGTQGNRDAGAGGISLGDTFLTQGDISMTVRPTSGAFAAGNISFNDITARRITINAAGTSVAQGFNTSMNASELVLLSPGSSNTSFVLSRATNQIDDIAGSINGSLVLESTGNLAIKEIGTTQGLTVSGSTSIKVHEGTLTQTERIVTPTLSAQTHYTGAGTGIFLTNADNDVSNLSMRAFQNDGTTQGSRHLTFHDANGFNVAGISTNGTVTLSGSDTIIQSSPIVATVGLFVTTRNDAGADIILDTQQNQTNTIGFIAYDSFGNVVAPAEVRYYDADGFTISDLRTTDCAFLRTADVAATITQSGAISPHNLALSAGNWTLTDPANVINGMSSTETGNINIATSGPMTISNVCGINGLNTTGFARLVASDFINQNQPIQATHLIARALNGAAITLENSSNDVQQLTLESRNANNTAFSNGALSYRDSDGFAVLRLGTLNNTSLAAGGIVNQVGSNSPLLTNALNLQGGSAANYTFDRVDNAFSILTGNVASANVFNTQPIVIGSYAGSVGFNASNFLRMVTLGTISQSSPITGDLVVARTMNNAGAQIFLNNANNNMSRVNLQVRNATNTAFANNDILYADSNAYSVLALGTLARASLSSSSGAGVDQAGASLPITVGALHVSGPNAFTLDNTANSFPLFAGFGSSINLFTNSPLSFGTVFSAVGTNVSSFLRVQARGDITQTQTLTGNLLVARTLSDSFTQVLLNSPSNNFAQINMQSKNAANNAIGGGRIVYADASGYSIVSLGTNEQAILRAAGPVNQNGASLPITVGQGIRLFGSGAFTLNNVNNAIPALAGGAGRTEIFTTTPLSITQLGVASGYVSSDDVVLTARGAITQDRQLRGVNLNAKTLNNAGANIILTTPGNLFTGTKTLRARNANDTADVAATLQYSE